ncbi:hypothetical protein [Corynebacterium pseudogenitalium]|uniref:Uncharacterized protein n=1 Tax=Corynebacterium pseudogenitalium TaxID=38303 RepID=A0ABD4TV29_9CORY|nr:hypothetical protein [Corynebacterium pseudogenitalium]MCQ4615181.1 hypothetical protein [Corynebacterium pseudogenitalium]
MGEFAALSAHIHSLRGRTVQAQRLKRAVTSGTMVRIGRYGAVEKRWWGTLDPDTRRIARALIHGRETRKAAIVGRTAARLHRLPVPHLGRQPELTEVALPNGTSITRSKWRPGLHYRRQILHTTDTIAGIRVAPLPETIAGIFKWEPRAQLYPVLNHLKHIGGHEDTITAAIWALPRQRDRNTLQLCWERATHHPIAPELSYLATVLLSHPTLPAHYWHTQPHRVMYGTHFALALTDAPLFDDHCAPTETSWVRTLHVPVEALHRDLRGTINLIADTVRATYRGRPHCDICRGPREPLQYADDPLRDASIEAYIARISRFPDEERPEGLLPAW